MSAVLRGFEGKLPSRGDFVSRGLPKSFLGPWQAWTAACLTASKAALGDRWLPAWLQAPIWRFVLPAGACGPDPVLGLLLPSVDRVGRHYPLMVAAVFTGHAAAPLDHAWLDAAEVPALDAVALDHDPDTLQAALDAVPAPLGGTSEGLWWTEGNALVPAASLPMPALPAASVFATMIDAGAVP